MAATAAYFVKASLGNARVLIALMVCSATFGAVFVIVAYVVGAVTDEEKSELRRVYRSGSRRLGLSSATEVQ